MTFITLLLALSAAATGCSLLSELRSLSKEELRNPQGHVVGQKETLRSHRTGEDLTRIALFTPWRNQDGEIVGYEQRTRGGAIIRDLKGNVIGGKYKDLRSRGTNLYSGGFAVVFSAPAVRKGAEGLDLLETAEAPNPANALDYVRLASLSGAGR